MKRARKFQDLGVELHWVPELTAKQLRALEASTSALLLLVLAPAHVQKALILLSRSYKFLMQFQSPKPGLGLTLWGKLRDNPEPSEVISS
jgi:hypothetical protein